LLTRNLLTSRNGFVVHASNGLFAIAGYGFAIAEH
jgi:hypothetical protein